MVALGAELLDQRPARRLRNQLLDARQRTRRERRQALGQGECPVSAAPGSATAATRPCACSVDVVTGSASQTSA